MEKFEILNGVNVSNKELFNVLNEIGVVNGQKNDKLNIKASIASDDFKAVADYLNYCGIKYHSYSWNEPINEEETHYIAMSLFFNHEKFFYVCEDDDDEKPVLGANREARISLHEMLPKFLESLKSDMVKEIKKINN